MSLNKYSKKRNFKNTPEPVGEIDNANQYRFVVQRHRASRLHYDLRLEVDGVLKSWAVPKGPSMQPNIKRLAIQTEDHPVKYLVFEGRIPKGNYGAGEMTIWDKGIYKSAEKETLSVAEQWKRGSLKIILEGSKLQGEFALVRTSQGEKNDQWLLFKKKDKFSTEEDYDAEDYVNIPEKQWGKKEERDVDLLKPMLATPQNKIFNHPDWIFELKWDGYRMLSSIKNGEVECYSRNGHSLTKKFSKIAKSLESIPHDAILDGEVVAMNKKGLPDFQALQNYPENQWENLNYYVFDLLYLNGHSTIDLKLTDRKSLIPAIIEDCEDVYYCEEIQGMGMAFYRKAVDAGMEGVMAKKADSSYTPGYRSKNWLKIKTEESQEAIICGYTDSEADSSFGSLILGIYQEGELIYIGNCGTGFSSQDKDNLLKKLKGLSRKTSPFKEKINLKGRNPHWVTPKLIAEIKFSEWTNGGKLRHPVFKGLRQDKEAEEIQRQEAVEEEFVESSFSSSTRSQLEIDGVSVPFSNLEKTYWPESGLRKYDLIDYYLHVSDIILPYLKDRPQNLHRHPNGINNKSFYHKDMDQKTLKPWMETVEIYSKSNQEKINYLVCQNEATLLYMANLGCIELNPWNSRIKSLDNPDYAIIDLDPSEKNTFEEVIETAQVTKSVLDDFGIPGFCKTSGSTGLHIFIPLGAKYAYDEARDFTKLLCLYIQNKLPKLTTLERAKNKRKGRIYLDYLQNRKGQTIAAAYCVRPKEGAPVSTPLEWKEVKEGLKINDFHLKNTLNRLEEKGDLFKGVFDNSFDMEKTLNQMSS